MVEVDFYIAKATIAEGEWSSNDAQLLSLLAKIAPPYGVSGAEPDSDLALARHAVDLFGGKILKFDEPESEEGVIY